MESTGRGHCPQAGVSPAGRKTFIPVNTGWGVQEGLRSDSGGRQRQHHPWAEPGRVLGAPNPCQKGLTGDGLCPSWFCFYFSHLDLSHLCSSHLCSLCPLSTAFSPFPVHHILRGPFLRKGKMPQVSRGSKSVFMNLQPFTPRKNVFCQY